MTGAASAAMHAVQTSPPGAQGTTAPVKSTTVRSGQLLGGGGGARGPRAIAAGDGGGGDGLGQALRALSEAADTPALNITLACAEMHAPSVAPSLLDTPAMTKGVASAVTHVVHAFATLEQGATAAEKSCAAETGHVGGGGDGGGAGGGEAAGQEPSATSDAIGTPAARMVAACALMQAPSMALSDDSTPAITKGVASAVTQVVQAAAVLAQGVTAAEKSCAAETEHTSGGGDGGGRGGGDGGGAAGHDASAVNDATLTPAVMMAPALNEMQTPRAAVSEAGTPAMTKTVASAVTQTVHAVVASAHGVTAEAKLRPELLTGQTTGGGNGGRGGGSGGGLGGGAAGHEPSAASDAPLTPSVMMATA
jgi:hypothetical protein